MKLEQADKRGFVQSFNLGGQEYLLIFSKAGAHRGGHTHDSTQFNILLKGTIEWNDEVHSAVFETKTLPNVFHKMVSVTDSLILEWRVK